MVLNGRHKVRITIIYAIVLFMPNIINGDFKVYYSSSLIRQPQIQ